MQEKYKERLTTKQLFSLPNILSYLRILLIPVIVYCYVGLNDYVLSVIIVFVSGLTDVLDGIIARKFNMITDWGKFIDPVADKLTQITLVCCVVKDYPYALILISLMLIKDLLLFAWGKKEFDRSEHVNSSRWYGKACTVIVYTVMSLLFLSPAINLSNELGYALLIFAGIFVLFSTVLYGFFYKNIKTQK
jgi:cardiolipin synthase